MSGAVELVIIDAQQSDVKAGMYSCEGLGDINNDGYNDFVLGVFVSNELQLYLGGPAPFDNLPAITWSNHGTPLGNSPFTPVNVGDVDCDGTNDFISVFSEDDTLKLFLGLENLDGDDYLVMYADSLARWDGFYISGGGDNNDDGRPDIWISKAHYKDTLYGYSGCDLLDSIHDFRIIPSRDPDDIHKVLGRDICTTCDLNGDSVPEIIYGQPANHSDYPGRICIVWGGESLSETPDLVLHGPDIPGNYEFGKDFGCLSDVSGDGIDDIWVSQGKINFIYFGGQPFDTLPDVTIDWLYMFANMENIGDINSDGYNDVMLVFNASLFSYVSYIYCYPGMDTLVDAAFSDDAYRIALQQGAISHVGYDHSWCGDVNGDGIDDALITAGEYGTGAGSEGRIIIQSGWDEPTAVDENGFEVPVVSKLELNQNYPNPFNSGTTIEFTLPRSSYTELKIYNLLGEEVTTLIEGELLSGEHRISWDGKDGNGNPTAAGIYFYRVQSGQYSETKKLIFLK